jgi:1-acyl-sn-glycerol-3-phosphate acyltransferase
MLQTIADNTRATARAAVGLLALPVFLGLTALQGFVVGPVTGNYTTIPNFLYNSLRKILGYKVEFNKASAPLAKDKSVWFVANHMSIADFVVLGSTLPGTFAGKGDILKWPMVASMARAVKYIGLRRSADFNPQSRAKIIKNFNAGFNTIMFPEGTTTDGKQVALFRAGLITLLYGEKGMDKNNHEVSLQKDVVLQPVAVRVTKVNGLDAIGNDDMRNQYSMFHENNTLTRIWKRLKIREITLELNAFPPMDPKDYPDAKALINQAALNIAGVVNPGQTAFEKAVIPGQAHKPAVQVVTPG